MTYVFVLMMAGVSQSNTGKIKVDLDMAAYSTMAECEKGRALINSDYNNNVDGFKDQFETIYVNCRKELVRKP